MRAPSPSRVDEGHVGEVHDDAPHPRHAHGVLRLARDLIRVSDVDLAVRNYRHMSKPIKLADIGGGADPGSEPMSPFYPGSWK